MTKGVDMSYLERPEIKDIHSLTWLQLLPGHNDVVLKGFERYMELMGLTDANPSPPSSRKWFLCWIAMDWWYVLGPQGFLVIDIKTQTTYTQKKIDPPCVLLNRPSKCNIFRNPNCRGLFKTWAAPRCLHARNPIPQHRVHTCSYYCASTDLVKSPRDGWGQLDRSQI